MEKNKLGLRTQDLGLRTNKYLRLIDANLNRCREGLRVVEDTARFIIEDGKLYKKIRALRHKLETITKNIYPELISVRESVTDPGRKIKEGKRSGVKGVLTANFKRVQESLRVLEEYSRLIAPSAGGSFKEIRYSVYNMEKILSAALKGSK